MREAGMKAGNGLQRESRRMKKMKESEVSNPFPVLLDLDVILAKVGS